MQRKLIYTVLGVVLGIAATYAFAQEIATKEQYAQMSISELAQAQKEIESILDMARETLEENEQIEQDNQATQQDIDFRRENHARQERNLQIRIDSVERDRAGIDQRESELDQENIEFQAAGCNRTFTIPDEQAAYEICVNWDERLDVEEQELQQSIDNLNNRIQSINEEQVRLDNENARLDQEQENLDFSEQLRLEAKEKLDTHIPVLEEQLSYIQLEMAAKKTQICQEIVDLECAAQCMQAVWDGADPMGCE